MLKDITIGQFFPGNSFVHRLDPRSKILLTVLFIILLFGASNPLGLGIGIVYLFVAFSISKIPLSMVRKSIKPVIPIILFTALLNMFFIDGTPLWRFWKIEITVEGLNTAIVMAVRIFCLIAGTSLLTYTTSPIALTDGIEQLFAPLKKLRMPVHELAMMMTIALRFIPTLVEETDKIMSAQKARGADMESGSLIQRAKALVPILIPLFICAFRRADELALAMECRCYRGDEGRTRMKRLQMCSADWLALGITLFCVVGVIAVNLLAPEVIPL